MNHATPSWHDSVAWLLFEFFPGARSSWVPGFPVRDPVTGLRICDVCRICDLCGLAPHVTGSSCYTRLLVESSHYTENLEVVVPYSRIRNTQPDDIRYDIILIYDQSPASAGKTHLFRKYPETLEKAIELSLEENFSLPQAYVHSSSYRPTKRDESGDPEPMDLSVGTGESHQSMDRSKKTCDRYKKPGHFAYECLAPRPAAQRSGARSSEYVGHLAVGAPKPQSLCFTTRGNDEPLITLEVHVDGLGKPLRALLDPGASNNFVRQQTLEVASMKYVERPIPSTHMTVRLATGATVKMMKRVVEIHYTCDGNHLDDDFIVLDLDDKFDVIQGMPLLRRHEPLVNWKRRSVRMDVDPVSGTHLVRRASHEQGDARVLQEVRTPASYGRPVRQHARRVPPWHCHGDMHPCDDIVVAVATDGPAPGRQAASMDKECFAGARAIRPIGRRSPLLRCLAFDKIENASWTNSTFE